VESKSGNWLDAQVGREKSPNRPKKASFNGRKELMATTAEGSKITVPRSKLSLWRIQAESPAAKNVKPALLPDPHDSNYY